MLGPLCFIWRCPDSWLHPAAHPHLAVEDRAVNQHSRCFTLLGAGPYSHIRIYEDTMLNEQRLNTISICEIGILVYKDHKWWSVSLKPPIGYIFTSACEKVLVKLFNITKVSWQLYWSVCNRASCRDTEAGGEPGCPNIVNTSATLLKGLEVLYL